MSDLLNRTLSAWQFIESVYPGEVPTKDETNSRLTKTLDMPYELNENNFENFWKNPDVEIRDTLKDKTTVQYRLYRFCYPRHLLDRLINQLDPEKTDHEPINKLYNKCFSYSFIVDSDGHVDSESIYIPTLMLTLDKLTKGKSLNNISDHFDQALEEFKEEAFKILKDEQIDHSKVLKLDQAFQKRFYTFDTSDQEFFNKPHLYKVMAFKKDASLTPLLNSFYLNDIKLAMENPNLSLKSYIEGSDERIDIDENVEFIEGVLTPDHLPDGRWPSKTEHHLSLMQQVAVNQITRFDQRIASVNGPPGTGKTTLLKDIFAHLVVERAKEIAKFDRPENLFEKKTTAGNTYPYYQLDSSVAQFKMVVASNNNGAVENISKDLPKLDEIIRNNSESEFEQKFQSAAEPLRAFASVSKNITEQESWGIFSGVFGNKKNITKTLSSLFSQSESDDDKTFIDLLENEILTIGWDQAKQNFNEALEKVHQEKEKLNSYRKLFDKHKKTSDKIKEVEEELQSLNISKNNMEKELNEVDLHAETLASKINICQREIKMQEEKIEKLQPGLMKKIKSLFKEEEQLKSERGKLEGLKDQLNHLQLDKDQKKIEENNLRLNLSQADHEVEGLESQIAKHKKASNQWQKIIADQPELVYPDREFWKSENYDSRQESNLWVTEELESYRSLLFIHALVLHLAALQNNVKSVRLGLQQLKIYREKDKIYTHLPEIKNAWNVLHLIMPVISTTFASFSSMYMGIDEDFIDYLFIDEAGQATPQSAAGAIWRSRHVVAVGDPFQIEPIATLGDLIYKNISKAFDIPAHLADPDSSVQRLADRSNKYGHSLEDEWIGIPLWVHRRCLDPMFTVSNKIAYHNRMVLPGYMKSTPGKLGWFNSDGKVTKSQFVPEHAEVLNKQLEKHWKENIKSSEPSKPSVYVITPFTAVKKEIIASAKKHLKQIFHDSSKDIDAWLKESVGTVHTFQGKEAKIVYFVTGTDKDQQGALQWSCSKPNLLNVAVTRAKEEFYIIGDYDRVSKAQYYKTIAQEVNE